MKSLQFATFGDNPQGIMIGIKNFPIHKLILLCYPGDKSKAIKYSNEIETFIDIDSEIILVKKENVVKDTIERVNEVLLKLSAEYHHILMNVSCGDKLINCAALYVAYLYGIKTFTADDNQSEPVILPVLTYNYGELLSDTKINILKGIDSNGGLVDSIEELEQISGYGKAPLIYHIQGGKENVGLVQLGLVEIFKDDHGKTVISITKLGKLIIKGKSQCINTEK
jgi:hypothetical protein